MPPQETSPRKLLAEVCGISERQVDKLSREGITPKPDVPGNYDVPEYVKAYIEFLRVERRRYTGKEMAAFLGVSETMVYKLHHAGMPQADRGVWDIQDCVRWIIQHERDKRYKANGQGMGDDADGSELARERLLAAREDRLLKQMAREERERTRLPREETETGWQMLSGLFVAALEALPGRLAQRMADAKTELEAQQGLRDEARRIRGELAEQLANLVKQARKQTVNDDSATAVTKAPDIADRGSSKGGNDPVPAAQSNRRSMVSTSKKKVAARKRGSRSD
jgi:phage terminase Nu1 subunit (DNA packaging protein)